MEVGEGLKIHGQKRLGRRRALGVAAVGVGSAAFAAACGSKKTSGTAGSSASQAGKPKYGGVLSINATEPAVLDPAPKNSQFVPQMRLTNDTLLDFKVGPDVKYTDIVLTGRLADRWESPDPNTYVFHLHPGVKMANVPPVNGRDLTPADIQWTFNYLTRSGPLKSLPPAPVSDLYQGLQSVDAPDQNTVVFHFAKPFAPFLAYSALNLSTILAHEIFDQDGDFTKHAVGSGPWQINQAETQHGSHWTFDKNPNYFVQGRPYIDQIKWLFLGDDATIAAAFSTKQIDRISANILTPALVQQIDNADPGAIKFPHPDNNGYLIYMNSSRPPLNDMRVRKAISYAIDRDEFIKSFAEGGQGSWALSAARAGLFTDQEIKQIVQFDLNQAKSLVAAAGYPNGVDLAMYYANNQYGNVHVLRHELLQAQLKKAGINITLKGTDGATEGKLRRSGDYQISMTPGGPGYTADLDSGLYGTYYPGASGNYSRANDPQLTPLLDAQRQELDPAKRKDILRQAVRRVNEVPWALGLVWGQTTDMWQSYLKNFYMDLGLVQMGDNFLNSWLEK